MKAKTQLTTHSSNNSINIFISLILVFTFLFSTWSCGKEEPMEKEMEEEMEEEMGYNYPEGKIFFDFPPMELAGAAAYEPMGGFGVFPQDHGGFYHFEYGVDEPTTPIYAMADGAVIELGAGGGDLFMTVKYSTTISTKLGHVGRFANFIADQTGPVIEGSPQDVEIEVTSGQIIGYISSLSALDIGVHDLDLEDSKYFCYPEGAYFENYFAADIFEYYKDENPVKAEYLNKNVRVLPPYGGKNDYDVEGTIAGNWYVRDKFEGKDGATNYFAIGYDHIYAQRIALFDGLPRHDPDIVDTYAYSWIKSNSPKPEEVDIAYGVVKYELIASRGLKRNADGTFERVSIDDVDNQIPRGVFLMQMLETKTMQLEFIADKTAAEVEGFSGNQRVYVRNPDYE
jgi:hypothetical protein